VIFIDKSFSTICALCAWASDTVQSAITERLSCRPLHGLKAPDCHGVPSCARSTAWGRGFTAGVKRGTPRVLHAWWLHAEFADVWF